MEPKFDDASIIKEFVSVDPPPAQGGPAADASGAFRAWSALLGEQFVSRDASTCDEYAKTTLPRGNRPSGVLRPSTPDDVVSVVQIAAAHGIRLHAISRGRNWGYGDACAPEAGQAIVDLGRLNRIREVNAELGYAVIEPGVTQGQLYQYLRDRNLPLLLDVTGAGPDASIVGNILQRGYGHTPYGDRFKHTSGLEVVLPDGRLIQTGFGRFETARASRVFPWGLGPWIDGLFTQSDYGIVTAVCVWLMPKPERIEAFGFRVEDDKFCDAVEAVRRLRMQQTVRSAVHLANDLRVISSRMRYPWDAAKMQTPLPDDLRRAIRQDLGLGFWNAIGGLYGTATEVRAARRAIRKEFRGIAKVMFFDRRKLAIAARFARPFATFRWARRLGSMVRTGQGVVDLLEGIPTDEHLSGVKWRDRGEQSEGLDPRDSGLIWIAPVIPATRQDVRRLLGSMEPIFSRFGFDFLITLASVTERSLCCVTSINYDKGDSEDALRAANCYNELMSELEKVGYIPYRSSSVSLKSVQ